MYRSMAPEKAAKPMAPAMIPCGPEFLARIAPVMNPPAMGFTISFLARYCGESVSEVGSSSYVVNHRRRRQSRVLLSSL